MEEEPKVASSSTTGPKPEKKPKLAAQSVRSYLDQTVVPILLPGLAAVAKQRPDDPVEFLANYLLENRKSLAGNAEKPAGGSAAE